MSCFSFTAASQRQHWISGKRSFCGGMRILSGYVLVLLMVFFLLSTSVYARPSYSSGLRTLGIWLPEKSLRLDINIWYPATRKASQLSYTPWTLQAARNSPFVEGKFPLLLLSHATPGNRFSYHETAARLAARGFIVVAPTHAGDNIDDMSYVFSLEQLTKRVEHLKATLDIVLSREELISSINREEIGVIGFSAGGTAALLLGGASLTGENWEAYCSQAGQEDVYCTPWAKKRLSQMAAALPLKEVLKDERIRAVAAIAPGYGMFFTASSCGAFTSELLLVRADADDVDRAPFHADNLRTVFSEKSHFASLPYANDGGMMSACPPALQEEMPEVCYSVNAEQREVIQKKLNALLFDFFNSVFPFVPEKVEK